MSLNKSSGMVAMINEKLIGFYLTDELVGQGATTSYGSDCYAYTVVGVKRFGSGSRKGQVRELAIQRDICKAIGGTWPDIEYNFFSDPIGFIEFVKFGLKKGGGCSIGIRREYRDPSF